MSPIHAIAYFILAIAALAKHDGIGYTCAFHIDGIHSSRGRSSSSPMPRTKRFSTEVENEETAAEGKSSSSMTLNFVGETAIASESAPKADNAKSLHDFFALPQSVLLLMRGSKNNKIVEIESIDDDLPKQYEQMCDKTRAAAPAPADRFFEVTTPGVKFPGLQINSVVTIGVKIITSTQDLPGYELVLIRDSTFAEGNRLFLWFFNKVTGKDKGDEGQSSGEQTTSSLNKINVVPTENDCIFFESNAFLSIEINFPSFLMKAIPGASKEKFEKTGGESLCKVLESDCPAALEAFRQEYVRWIEN